MGGSGSGRRFPYDYEGDGGRSRYGYGYSPRWFGYGYDTQREGYYGLSDYYGRDGYQREEGRYGSYGPYGYGGQYVREPQGRGMYSRYVGDYRYGRERGPFFYGRGGDYGYGAYGRSQSPYRFDRRQDAVGYDGYGSSFGLDRRGYGGGYDGYGSSYSFDRRGYGGGYEGYGSSYGLDKRGYGLGYDGYSNPYGYDKRLYGASYDGHSSPYGYDRRGYGLGYDGYKNPYQPDSFRRYGYARYGDSSHYGYSRSPYTQYLGPQGYRSYGPSRWGIGYDSYEGPSGPSPFYGSYGRSPYEPQARYQYGGGRDSYGYFGDDRGHGDGVYGQYGYRPLAGDGRVSYAWGTKHDGYRNGPTSYLSDQYGTPLPFPPFAQTRSFYPTSFEFYDGEDFLNRLRLSRAKEMAVRANFDLQRRKLYENVTETAQNHEFKHVSVIRRDSPSLYIEPLKIEFIDLLPKLNSKDHRTFPYELVQSGKPAAVFRRGQSFFMDINLQNRPFSSGRDCIFVNFYLGPNPSVPKRTRVVLPVTMQEEFQKAPSQWDVRVYKQELKRITLQVHIPSTASIGCWNCLVETSLTRHFKRSRLQFRPSTNLYIIFNPFCSDDSTFLDNDDLRTEYLMNDKGKIFMGGFKSAKGRPWIYGQFDDCVLPAACVLLEMSRLAHSEWGNPAKVVRAISSMIKAVRSGRMDPLGKSIGLIIPRYEEEFRGGSSPHLWTGSVQIIEEFLKGGAAPVKYGHCWVMAALMTTFCRSFGIPARPVTAFVAALNTQDSMTVDKYIDRFGNIVERGAGRDQPDSLWAFHTWCDVWMLRPDLPTGNSGWQACDPTLAFGDALERACGPCPSEALRKGDIGFGKDTDSMYSVLNAYVRYFYEAEQSEWGFLPFMQFRFPVARYILTKAPNRIDDEGDDDFEDVTPLYKDMDLSPEERLMIYNAFRGRSRSALECDFEAASSAYGPLPMVKEREELDVTFIFQEPVRVPLGEPVTLSVDIHNTSDTLRTVQANISCRSMFYTGVLGPHIKRVTGQFTLEPGQEERLGLRIDPLEYQEKLIDMSFFKVTATGFVRETLQSYVDEFDFRFDKPKLTVEMPEECLQGKECPFDLSFLNPLGMTLTECFVTFEVNGSVRPKTVPVDREVGPRQLFQFHCTFTPRRPGMRHLVACFSSKQLSDINGMKKIVITE